MEEGSTALARGCSSHGRWGATRSCPRRLTRAAQELAVSHDRVSGMLSSPCGSPEQPVRPQRAGEGGLAGPWECHTMPAQQLSGSCEAAVPASQLLGFLLPSRACCWPESMTMRAGCSAASCTSKSRPAQQHTATTLDLLMACSHDSDCSQIGHAEAEPCTLPPQPYRSKV